MNKPSFPALALATTAKLFASACLLTMAADVCAAPAFKEPDPRETRRLMSYLDSKDCAGAVQAMKDGMKARQPDVILMSAGMVEDGICVKSDWEKAEKLYLLAAENGSPSALNALVAGLAVAGRDNGKALWYSAQHRTAMPSDCIPKADPLSDPEGFNQSLERMPAKQFKECVYMAGVVHEVFARVQFPGRALVNGVQGKVLMTFKPSAGTIDWQFAQSTDAHAVYRSMDKAQFDDERTIERALLDYMRAKGKFALARYARPEGIDPAIVLKGEFVFTISN